MTSEFHNIQKSEGKHCKNRIKEKSFSIALWNHPRISYKWSIWYVSILLANLKIPSRLNMQAYLRRAKIVQPRNPESRASQVSTNWTINYGLLEYISIVQSQEYQEVYTNKDLPQGPMKCRDSNWIKHQNEYQFYQWS
jgi:hypothetical protein